MSTPTPSKDTVKKDSTVVEAAKARLEVLKDNKTKNEPDSANSKSNHQLSEGARLGTAPPDSKISMEEMAM